MNLKPSILVFLVGGLLCSCGCDDQTAQPQETTMPRPEDFPIVKGDYRMTNEWSIALPDEHRRRFEDGSLVIWRPGITMWINAWGMQDGETPKTTLERIKSEAHPSPVQTFEPEGGVGSRFGYLLHEQEEGDERWALYTFTVGSSGYLQMALYFDNKSDLEKAKQLWLGVKETPESGNQ